MSDGSLVSVILIFFNAEQFLHEAIQSVFAQSYDNWELLLVDDGSTDGSTDIARRHAGQHPDKIRCLEHPGRQNRGMSASRNLGITNSNGEYIAFLDADDVWLPNKLKTQVAELESQPQAAMVYGPTQWWYSWTGDLADRQRDYIHELGVPADTLLPPPLLLTRFLREEGISPCTCSALLRRQAVTQINGFEEAFRGLYEDQAFFAKICLSAPVYISPVCSARYRQHEKSNYSITQRDGEYFTARKMFLKWLEDYLAQAGNKNVEVWHALRKEILPYRFPILYRIYQGARLGLPGKISRLWHELRLRWLSLPIIRQVRCLQLRRLAPVRGGQQRGTPVVRYYWEKYLNAHQEDIQGRALEIGTTYTLRRLGGQAVTLAEAIDLSAHSPEITVVADLSRADHLPSNRYDCFIDQFTMHLIYDVEAALYHAVRILNVGGVLLVNFPCVDTYFPRGLDMGTGEPLFMYWWFTPIQVENMLRRVGLEERDYSLQIYGNLFTRIAYQMNIPSEELTRRELDYTDPSHPLLICARVVKPAGWQAPRPLYRDAWRPQVASAQWNPETGHYAV